MPHTVKVVDLVLDFRTTKTAARTDPIRSTRLIPASNQLAVCPCAPRPSGFAFRTAPGLDLFKLGTSTVHMVTEGFASPKLARILLAVSAISHSSPTRLQSSDALVVQKHHLLNLRAHVRCSCIGTGRTPAKSAALRTPTAAAATAYFVSVEGITLQRGVPH